jgi:hypothetical protein
MKVLITEPAKESLKEICDRYRRLEFDSYAVKVRKTILDKSIANYCVMLLVKQFYDLIAYFFKLVFAYRTQLVKNDRLICGKNPVGPKITVFV